MRDDSPHPRLPDSGASTVRVERALRARQPARRAGCPGTSHARPRSQCSASSGAWLQTSDRAAVQLSGALHDILVPFLRTGAPVSKQRACITGAGRLCYTWVTPKPVRSRRGHKFHAGSAAKSPAGRPILGPRFESYRAAYAPSWTNEFLQVCS